jgi:aryl carrier-like protein
VSVPVAAYPAALLTNLLYPRTVLKRARVKPRLSRPSDTREVTREDLAGEIARMTEVSHEDVPLPLSSVDVMRIVNMLRIRGLPVSYQDLAAELSLDAWWTRISHLLAENPHLAA